MSIAPRQYAESAGGAHQARPDRWILALGCAAPSSLLLVGATSLSTTADVALVVLASACMLELVRREARDPGSPVPIVAAIVAAFTVAVLCPPRFSHDIWSYAMVGRIAAVHHASPYLHAPAAFGHDAFIALVGNGYRHTTTPYGPLFVVHAAVVALIAGAHPLLYRLAFQASAAAAIGVALRALWRSTKSTSALVLLALHPVVICTVINGGHNDALVGLGLLLAVLDVRRERYTRAGWWITAALLVKVTAGLALIPIVAWVWVRGDWAAVRRVVTGPLLFGVPVMLLTPGVVSSLGHGQIGVVSRASIWNLALRLPAAFGPAAPHVTGGMLGPVAFLVVIAVGGYAAWGTCYARDVTPGVVAALAAWLVFGGYVLPWYTVWALAVAALVPRDRITWVVAVQGAVIMAAWLVPRSTIAGPGPVSVLVRYVVPVGLAFAFVWALVESLGPRSRGQASVAAWLNHVDEAGTTGNGPRRSSRGPGSLLVPRRTRVRRAGPGADPEDGGGASPW